MLARDPPAWQGDSADVVSQSDRGAGFSPKQCRIRAGKGSRLPALRQRACAFSKDQLHQS